jgi:hypothetical protein
MGRSTSSGLQSSSFVNTATAKRLLGIKAIIVLVPC